MLTRVSVQENGHVHVATQDDVEAVLEHNKRLRAMSQSGETFRHCACIPNSILVKWLNEERNRGHDIQFLSKEMDEMVARKLRDPDWAYLRTDGVRHRVGYGS
jgi:hypothetical protein